MFNLGASVVCLNDDYAPWVFEVFKQLPIKGHTYTVRAFTFRRTELEGDPMDSMEESILLSELINPHDPLYTGGKAELAFKASRFGLLEEVFESIKK